MLYIPIVGQSTDHCQFRCAAEERDTMHDDQQLQIFLFSTQLICTSVGKYIS